MNASVPPKDHDHIFKESSIPMYIFEIGTFRFLSVNTAALSQYGYTEAEFMAITPLDIRPEEDKEAFLNVNANLPDTYFDSGRWRHLRKNGQVFYVNIFVHITEFEAQKAILVLAVDIDEKVRTELLLQEKGKEVESVLESITDAFYSLDHHWQFTYVNTAYEKLLHRNREDLIGKNIWELFPYGRLLNCYEQYQRVMREKISVHFEDYLPTHNLWISIRAYPSQNGLTAYIMDITEQRKLRDQIHQEQQNLRAIIDNTEDIIWLVNRDFQLVATNNAFSRRVSELMGRPSHEVSSTDYPPEVLETWLSYYERSLLGKPFKVIWKANLNGYSGYDEVHFNPILDNHNEVIAISCFSRDITEARLHEEKIKMQNLKLKEIALLQSHQVRAPVANIIGLISMFEMNDASAQNQQIMVMLNKAAAQMDQTIHQIIGHIEEMEC